MPLKPTYALLYHSTHSYVLTLEGKSDPHELISYTHVTHACNEFTHATLTNFSKYISLHEIWPKETFTTGLLNWKTWNSMYDNKYSSVQKCEIWINALNA